MTNLVHVSTEGKQTYVTPEWLIVACEQRFGVRFILDLAASAENKRAKFFISEEQDALSVHWSDRFSRCILDYKEIIGGTPAAWLNPPFRGTQDFAPLLDLYGKRMKIITLTLASLDADWYLRYFRPSALSLLLEERVIFEGETERFPKALMISLFGFGMTGLGWWSIERDVLGDK